MRIRRSRLNILSVLLAGVCAWSTCAHAARDANAIELGVFPYISTRALLELYEPIRVYIQHETQRSTFLYTAPNYKTYVDHGRSGAYDLMVTPPHLARLAQRETGYIPLVMFTRELRGIVVVAQASPIHSLQDLKGKRIVSPNSIALVSIMGGQLLRDQGVWGEGITQIREMGSHSNAVLAVQRNEADAALTEAAALRQMSEDLRNSVRIIAQTKRLPHVMILAHPRLGPTSVERLRSVLLQFADTVDGKNFLKTSGFEGLRAVEEGDLKAMDSIQRDLKRTLETLSP